MPGFKVTITRKGVPIVYRFHNVLVGEGVRPVLKKPTLFQLGSSFNAMGFYSAGTITKTTTLASPSFTEFTDYDHPGSSVRLSTGFTRTIDTINCQIKLEAGSATATITASGTLVGLFICNTQNPVFDFARQIFAGGEFDTPVSVLPGDTVDAEYEAIINI